MPIFRAFGIGLKIKVFLVKMFIEMFIDARMSSFEEVFL